jgi:hypothetical protein
MTCRLTRGVFANTVDVVSHSNYSFNYPITNTPENHFFEVTDSPVDLGVQYCVRFENITLKHYLNPQQNISSPNMTLCDQLSAPPQDP